MSPSAKGPCRLGRPIPGATAMQPVARRFPLVSRDATWLPVVLVIFAPLTSGAALAQARPPRGERVINRAAERAYARASIAEARAARAEARVAAITPIVPVPPPPRPATVRRMRRAGVPLGGQPPLVSAPAPVIVRSAPPAAGNAVVVSPAPPQPIKAAPRPAAPIARAPRARPAAADPSPARDQAADGTRSVLATAEEPANEGRGSGAAEPAGGEPPIELLPTPQPQ
jgi:hypothetical protein